MLVSGQPRSIHVLVVDDDATNRLVASKICELFGAICETAASGEEAVAACASNHYDLVLMDIRMPSMDGFEASCAIRALPGPAGEIPIIAVTGEDVHELGDRCRNAGMSAAVQKPIVFRTLFETMEATLRDGFVAASPSRGDQVGMAG